MFFLRENRTQSRLVIDDAGYMFIIYVGVGEKMFILYGGDIVNSYFSLLTGLPLI
ncbi:hypothetical protein HanPI659440_Chr12g0479001 [Helianthus annuus]|nr:hypothetical protein HanPI659440_Chr12g0479001 [Helianthus annuus]